MLNININKKFYRESLTMSDTDMAFTVTDNQRRWTDSIDQMRNNQLQLQEFSPAQFQNKKPLGIGRQHSINAVLHQFCSETSTHGPSQIYRVQSLTGKFIWGLFFMGAMIAVIVHLSVLVEKYQKWPTQEMTSLQHVAVSFPDVTVCSSRKVSFTNLKQQLINTSSKVQQYMKLLAHWTSNIDNAWVQRRSKAGIGFFENIGPVEASLIGNARKDFLVQCISRGVACTEEQISKYVNPYFYNCYTFNGASVPNDMTVAGPGYGLAMILYLETYNGTIDGEALKTSSILGNSIGVRVIVHPPGTLPMPYTHGIDIMPGHSTSVALTVERIKRLSKPYTNCTNNITLTDLPEFHYSLPACIELCMQHRCQSSCGCQTSYHPLPSNSTDKVYCGTLYQPPEQYINSTLCEYHAWLASNNSTTARDDCNCPVQCESYNYKPIITESYWPDPAYYQNFFDNTIGARPDRENLKSYNQLHQVVHDDSIPAQERLDIIRLNFARLNVYFRDLDISTREQIASYGIFALFSDFGGTMGLWVGISIVSIVELIQFVITLSIIAMDRLRRSRQTRARRVQDE